MPQEKHYCYEFDGFLLDPSERILSYEEKSVSLKGKDFDVLVCLVTKSQQLVSKEKIFAEVWGENTFIELGNITTNISNIRKALGDNSRNPKYVESIPKFGYRFKMEVKETPILRAKTDTNIALDNENIQRTFEVESHKFVPMILGEGCYDELDTQYKRENQWAKYKEISTETGRFCLLPFGVGVWHLVETLEFQTLTDLAIWRRRTYGNIKAGHHLISSYAEEFFPLQEKKEQFETWKDNFAKPGYVLSAFILKEPIWEDEVSLKTALKLLCCPTTLQSESNADLDREEAIKLENRFLRDGFPYHDIKQFGVLGFDTGFASWAGVSYYHHSKRREGFVKQLIEFEIAVQATWWFSSCLQKSYLSNGNDKVTKWLERQIRNLVKQIGRLTHIGANEPSSQRTMQEAILETSRVENSVEITIDLYNKLKG